MLTRNWYRLISLTIFATTNDSNSAVTCKNSKGTTTNIPANNFLFQIGFNSSSLKTSFGTGSSSSGVIFGTGDIAPTLDDYTLSGNVISGISMTSSKSSVGKEEDAEYASFTTVYSITNNNTEEVTVREIASMVYGCIVDRTVLDTPITIPAGGIGQVTYTIRMNYPTV